MRYRLGVDLGATYSAAAVHRPRGVEVVSLGDHSVTMPSAVLVREDGRLVCGDAAERQAAGDPTRLGRDAKRRLGDPTPLVLGGRELPPATLLAALLSDIVATTARLEGGPPDSLALTYPAVWGPYRRELFGSVPRLAGLGPAQLVSEPVAAARYFASIGRIGTGDTVVVYDLGGATFDTAVARVRAGGIELLGHPQGIEHLGGIDFDDAIVAYVDDELGGAVRRLDHCDPVAAAVLAQLRRDCTLAKETLSVEPDATIPVYLPSGHRTVRLTRATFERLIATLLPPTVDVAHRALSSAGVAVTDVAAVLLVGGSSRIPLVRRLVTAELGRPVRVDAHPKHAVALGAALLAGEPETARGGAAVRRQESRVSAPYRVGIAAAAIALAATAVMAVPHRDQQADPAGTQPASDVAIPPRLEFPAVADLGPVTGSAPASGPPTTPAAPAGPVKPARATTPAAAGPAPSRKPSRHGGWGGSPGWPGFPGWPGGTTSAGWGDR